MSSPASTSSPLPDTPHLRENASRKVLDLPNATAAADDSLTVWADRYLNLAVRGCGRRR